MVLNYSVYSGVMCFPTQWTRTISQFPAGAQLFNRYMRILIFIEPEATQ